MNKNFTLIVFLAWFLNPAVAQNYATGKTTINFVDESRSNRQIPTEIYYPADTNGDDVPLAAGTEKFPIVVFGHGFVIPVSAYVWLADSLVKNGYVVAFPATEGDLSPSHGAFGDDLLFLCNRLASTGDSTGSFLYHRIIPKAAVSGHSMGGGCSFLAAAGNSSVISALFNFSAAETDPSATTAAALVNKPTLIFSGSSDCIVPPSVQQQMFSNIIASCKTYINITGALHCQFANNNGTCSLGQVLSGCNSSGITPEIVFNKTVTLLIPFLDFYLKDICVRGDDYLNAYTALTGVEKERTCNSFPECGILPVTLENFKGRLANKVVNLNWKMSSQDNVDYFNIERSTDGIAFQFLQKVNAENTLSGYSFLDPYPYPGYSYYRLRIISKEGQMVTSPVIKIVAPEKNLALVTLFPNPVKDNIQVQLFSLKMQKVIIGIDNTAGQTLIRKSVSLDAGLNTRQVFFSGLYAGVYILSVEDEKGTEMSRIKIMKE